MAVKPGDILRDKFRIDALIGRGGMGHVFAATDLSKSPQEQVAIKVVSRLLVDDVLMVRLHREAEAAQRVQSDFVPRVFEVSDTPEGETFLVMERLVGEPLSQRIRECGALTWPEVARTGEDVLRGLIDAHTAGIIHRDLKPSNVFLALKSGRIRAMVLDFGVCKMDGLDTERLTGTGESIGTVAYMAPEQIRGASRVDQRADLYAFGVLVFEMLCGRLPHDGPSQMAILASKLENAPSRLRESSATDIPEGIDELVDRALSRDPAKRFTNARELLKAWRLLSKSDKLILASTPPPPPRVTGMDDPTDAATERSRPRSMPPLPVMLPLLPLRTISVASDPPPLLSPLPPGADTDPDMAETASDLSEAARPARGSLADADANGERQSLAPASQIAVNGARPSRELDTHPTQTSLATGAGFGARGGGGKASARLALILAVGALIVGIVVVGISFSRPTRAVASTKGTGSAVSSDPSDGASAAELPSATASEAASSTEGEPALSSPAATESGALFELPADPTSAGPKPRPAPPRVRVGHPPPPAPAPAPATSKAGSGRITTEPRY